MKAHKSCPRMVRGLLRSMVWIMQHISAVLTKSCDPVGLGCMNGLENARRRLTQDDTDRRTIIDKQPDQFSAAEAGNSPCP